MDFINSLTEYILNLSDKVNFVTVIIACAFFLPILSGIILPFSNRRIFRSFSSFLGTLEFIVSIILAVYVTRRLLAGDSNIILTRLYSLLPTVEEFISGKSIWVYLVFIFVLLTVFRGLMRLLTLPLRRYVVEPISDRLASAVSAMGGFSRRLIGGLWQTPRAVCGVLVFSLFFSVFSSFYSTAPLTAYIGESALYQLIDDNVTSPLLSSGIARQIPVILNNSFEGAADELTDETGRILVIRYFNGTSLSEAIKSSTVINETAVTIVGNESEDKEKAHLIYRWICENIDYDYDKAALIANKSLLISSGARVAFEERSGVCFDYACLYTAMCRAVDVNVRFVTGLGYSGTYWGDHSWNQAYCSAEDRWINVDATFGSSGGNYFDRSNFSGDHKDGVVQGEW
ncbi:MAG: transglutaminase-like domain-containing protein [Oscillospiraceae bacterium]